MNEEPLDPLAIFGLITIVIILLILLALGGTLLVRTKLTHQDALIDITTNKFAAETSTVNTFKVYSCVRTVKVK